MKRVLVTLAMILLVTTAAHAQGLGYSMYVGGGMSMPLGPDEFKDGWASGFNAGGEFAFLVSPNIEIGVALGYNSFAVDEDGTIDAALADNGMTELPTGMIVEVDGGDASIFEVVADLRYIVGNQTESKFKPYFFGSVGQAAVKQDAASITVTYEGDTFTETSHEYSESDMVFGGGAGFLMQMGPTTSLFVEGRYMSVNAEEEAITYAPLKAGIRIMFGGGE